MGMRSRGKINHRGLGKSLDNDLGGEAGPLLAGVEDDAVGADDDCVGFAQLGVGAEGQADFPGPVVFAGDPGDQGLEPAAVGDRAVEEPEGLADGIAGTPYLFRGVQEQLRDKIDFPQILCHCRTCLTSCRI